MPKQPSSDKQPLFTVERYMLEESVGYWMHRAKSSLSMSMDQALMPNDITHQQAALMMRILKSGEGSVTPSAMSRDFCIDVGAMTRLVDRLEKRGLIARVRSEEDRRVVKLMLTGEGRTLAAKLPELFVGVLNARFNDFSHAEVDNLKALLRKIADNRETS
ncbi:MAG: MarR family transcriptional regulator [Candidatus Protistobacter heckmanni]|nr:MarR family transcriptional regulator [Candidatus Protistobacter heckmanni]